MFGWLIPDWLKMGAAGLAGALLAAGPIYIAGKHEGRQAARVEQLEADVAAYVEREGIDNEVDGMDRYRICIDLGGMRDQCEQLRRLEETTEGE